MKILYIKIITSQINVDVNTIGSKIWDIVQVIKFLKQSQKACHY